MRCKENESGGAERTAGADAAGEREGQDGRGQQEIQHLREEILQLHVGRLFSIVCLDVWESWLKHFMSLESKQEGKKGVPLYT